jgi:predicted amidohydrolase YtcJ
LGADEEIKQYITRTTKQYRFDNQLILPGFHDIHVHIFCGSLYENSVDLHDAQSEKEAAWMVKKFSNSNPDDDWILGFGWYHVFWKEKKLPTRNSLDKYLPDRPVFLINAELHGAWVNGKALEICDITTNTLDPPYGTIERDSKGEPTGFLYETAMGLVASKAFELKKERRRRIFQSFLKKAARLGVTAVSDMMPLPGMELGGPDIYREFENDGRLTTRIHMVLTLGDDLSRPQKYRQFYKSDKLRFSALKSFLDGVATTYTALMIEPYEDKPDTKGIMLVPTAVANNWIRSADKEGFQIRLHACGDGAVRFGLDCFEEAQKRNGRRDARHSIEHIENIHAHDAARFQELGVIASVQPEHLAITPRYSDNPYRQRLGKEREKLSWPNKTLLDNRAVLALGSDYPVVELNPMIELYRAVTRVHNDGQPEGGWNPEQKLTLSEALRAYTFGSAYAAHRENEIGTLEAGKLADIVVLDRNLFEIPAEDILKAKVLLTVMDGKVVYQY